MFNRPSIEEIQDATLAKPGSKIDLKEYPTHGKVFFADKAEAKRSLKEDALAIDELQERLYAEKSQSLLVVFQGIDTSGKDGTTKAVFSQTSPLGMRVHAFGKPSANELDRDYLWRIHRDMPRKGEITVFNRSHYEDVLVGRVRNLAPKDQIEERYEQINNFEKHLTQNGVTIIKLMLHISRETQGERLLERLEVPEKRWKFNPGDLEDRKLWDDYQDAYQLAVERCSTEYAPWYIVPSDSRARRKATAARLVRGALEKMDPKIPDPGYRPEQFDIG
ncbi:PPK2 family polyphosphate kinase [Hirschia litorea]|uniref:PPK2 family polyphosphate kinase n=1 Tax=Hirschia litorea TaxID=1199156 RepID=A0ABW2ILM3_9PROT